MKAMKLYPTILTAIILMVGWTSMVSGQTKLNAGWSEQGALIYLRGAIPVSDNLRLIRHSITGDSIEIAELKPAKNIRQFRDNESKMPGQLREILSFSDQAVETILKELKTADKFEDVQGGWLTPMLFAAGYSFTDTNAIAGEVSHYSISDKSDRIARSNKLPDEIREQLPMDAYRASSQDQNPKLIWRTHKDARKNVLSFMLYRSAPFDINFEPIASLAAITASGDSLFLIARDTSLSQPAAYQYMIRTINHFGRLSSPSEFQLAAYSPYSGFPLFSFADASGSSERPEIEINWRLEGAALSKSIELYRSRNFDGPFAKIAVLNSTDTSYTDRVDFLKEQYFYYLSAIPVLPADTNRSPIVTHLSTFAAQSFPPVDLSAIVDSSTVQLSWMPFESTELGYYVWRSEGAGMPMQRISGLVRRNTTNPQCAWVDTSQSLRGDRMYGYAITAIAQGFAESGFSDTLMVRPLRHVEINAPDQTRIIRKDENTWLFVWADMQPELSSLGGYEVDIKRANASSEKAMSPQVLSRNQNYLEIMGAETGSTLRVRAVDVFGNRSRWSNSATIPERDHINIGPKYIQGVPTEKGILLKWFVRDANVQAYKIHRIDADGKQKVFEIIDPLAQSFIDTSAGNGATYGYWLVSFDKENRESDPTEIVFLKKEF